MHPRYRRFVAGALFAALGFGFLSGCTAEVDPGSTPVAVPAVSPPSAVVTPPPPHQEAVYCCPNLDDAPVVRGGEVECVRAPTFDPNETARREASCQRAGVTTFISDADDPVVDLIPVVVDIVVDTDPGADVLVTAPEVDPDPGAPALTPDPGPDPIVIAPPASDPSDDGGIANPPPDDPNGDDGSDAGANDVDPDALHHLRLHASNVTR